MFRRSSVIFVASLALLSTLDSATCFAAAAPAQPREDLERPRFLKKEIKRFVFSNTTTSRGGSPDEASTSNLDALHDALTSSLPLDLDAGATPTSATPTITTISSVTPSDIDQSSSPSDLSLSLAGDSDRDREAIALNPTTTTTPVSSAPQVSSSPNDSEGSSTQSSIVSGVESDGATGSSQSLPSSSASHSDQTSGNEAVPQATHSSTFEQPGNGVTSSQLGSTAQLESSASPSSTALSIATETSVSDAGGQGPSTSDSQTSTSIEQQTNTPVQPTTSQGLDAFPSSSSSESGGLPPVTTSIASSPSSVPAAGKTTTSNSETPPVTTAGAGSSAVAVPAETSVSSSTNDEAAGVTTTTGGVSPVATSAGDLAAVSGETIKTSSTDTDNYSPPGGVAASGTSTSNTKTDNEGSANTNSNVNYGVSTTLGSGAGAETTNAAQPASSPFAPQSVAVPATGKDSGSETSHVTAGSGDTQPTSTPGLGAGSTSQNDGLLGPSVSVALQPNPVHAVSQVGGSPSQTTLADGAVVSNPARITGAAQDTATPLENPPTSVASPVGDQISSPSLNPGVTQAPSIANPSFAAAASKLNAIPALTENPLASVSGSPSLIPNPALTAAASALDALPPSVKNPEHQVSLPGSPQSSSLVVPGFSNSPGGVSQNTPGVTVSPVVPGTPAGTTGSPVGGTTPAVGESGSPIGATGSLVGGTASPNGVTGSPAGETGSPAGATGSPVGGTASPNGATGSPAGATGSPVGGTASPNGATGSPVGATGSPAGATGSPAGETGLPAGITGSPVATGSPVGASGSPISGTGSPVGETGSPYASAEPTPGQISGGLVQSSGDSNQNPQNTAPSATQESGIAGYSTQSNGNVVPISAAAGTGSTVSNGQIVPIATGHQGSAQLPEPNETAAAAASNAVAASNAAAASESAQSAAAVAAGATQNNAAPPGPTATPVVAPHQQYFGKGPYTQLPVGYDTSTTQVVPTNIIHGPSSTPSATQGSFGPFSLPSNVPQILYQNGGPGSQPPNTRLINLAFRYALNYPFVYNHTVAQQQVFHYVPLGICYGLEIEITQITMQSLRAWDTYEDVGYVTTLALAWIPEGLVDSLGLLVSTKVSRFYRNPDNSTAFLLSMINNAIPIVGSNATDGASTPFGNIPSDTSSAKTAGAPIGGDIGNSEHVRASSVGIGVGVACGAAAYGAAMFFVARRYKKRRQSHMRSPSMFSSPVMSHAGPDAGAGAALMSGAMGERSASPYYDDDGRAGSRGSGRSGSSRHQISAPVMAENSLGWN